VAGSRPVNRAVHDDSVQPWAEGPPAIEAVQRPDCGQKRLLGDVLGRRGVVHDQERCPVSPAPVRAKKRLHRLVRADLRLADPRALATAGGQLASRRPRPSSGVEIDCR
jgi:hypothetical protein